MEIFKHVVGYGWRYMVSNLGNVKSMERTVATGRNGTRIVPEGLLKLKNDRRGYPTVALWANYKQRRHKVHRLVAAAFIGPCPEGYQCCHNDGNPANGAVSNLRYDTPAGNQADRLLHGTHSRGERHGRCRLKEAQVLSIRADTRTQKTIAAEYGISQKYVYDIQCRKSWAWL